MQRRLQDEDAQDLLKSQVELNMQQVQQTQDNVQNEELVHMNNMHLSTFKSFPHHFSIISNNVESKEQERTDADIDNSSSVEMREGGVLSTRNQHTTL